MPVNDITATRGYQLPHATNNLDYDVARLRASFSAIDADVAGLLTSVAGKAAASHTHVISDVSGLQAALDGKLATNASISLDFLSDVNTAGAVTNQFLRLFNGQWVPVSLDGSMIETGTLPVARLPAHLATTALNAAYSPIVHSHTIADVTNLQTTLNGKANLSGANTFSGVQTINTTVIEGDGSIELSKNRTTNGDSLIDFHTLVGTDYEFRIIRESGANANAVLDNTGTGITVLKQNGNNNVACNNDGSVIVGGTTKGSNTGFLHVTGTISGTGIVGRNGTGGTSNNNAINFWWTGSALQAYVDNTLLGTVSITSDYRIKKNVETQAAPAIERVMNLRPVTYEIADYGDLFKADGVTREGFIAHEVQEVIPSGAEGEKDAEDRIQNLRLDAILSVAVKAIQEQQALISAMEDRIAALEAAQH